MEDEKIMEILKIQTRPKIHIGIEEKIPTVQYGNKTYTVNISDFIDEKITIEDIEHLFEMASEAIRRQKVKDGLIKDKRPLTSEEEALVKKAVNEFVKDKEEAEKPKHRKSLIDKAFENEKENG